MSAIFNFSIQNVNKVNKSIQVPMCHTVTELYTTRKLEN